MGTVFPNQIKWTFRGGDALGNYYKIEPENVVSQCDYVRTNLENLVAENMAREEATGEMPREKAREEATGGVATEGVREKATGEATNSGKNKQILYDPHLTNRAASIYLIFFVVNVIIRSSA